MSIAKYTAHGVQFSIHRPGGCTRTQVCEGTWVKRGYAESHHAHDVATTRRQCFARCGFHAQRFMSASEQNDEDETCMFAPLLSVFSASFPLLTGSRHCLGNIKGCSGSLAADHLNSSSIISLFIIYLKNYLCFS